MKIKAIIFLFLVIILSNSYSMDNNQSDLIFISNENLNDNNFLESDDSLFHEESSCEQLNSPPFEDDLSMHNCDKNGFNLFSYDSNKQSVNLSLIENSSNELVEEGIKKELKFDEIGKFKNTYKFLEVNGYIELNKSNKKCGFKCLVCKKFFKRVWLRAHEHFVVHGRKIIRNDSRVYSFELIIKDEDIKNKKSKEKLIELEWLTSSKNCIKNNNIEGSNLNNLNCRNDIIIKGALILPRFKDVFKQQEDVVKNNNQQENIQQNGFSGGGNNNIGKDKKKRSQISKSGKEFNFEDKGPAKGYGDFLVKHNYIKRNDETYGPGVYFCFICERNLKQISKAQLHFKLCHFMVEYDGTNYSFEGEMDRHYRKVHSRAIVSFKQSNDQQNNTQNNSKKSFPSFKQAFGEGVLTSLGFKDLSGEQNGSTDSGNNNIGKEPEDKRRKLD